MVILSAPFLALAAVILSLSHPAEAAPKFLLPRVLVETDANANANDAGKGYTENDPDEYKDEIEDNDDKMESLIKGSIKALTKAEKDNKGAGQDYSDEKRYNSAVSKWLSGAWNTIKGWFNTPIADVVGTLPKPGLGGKK